MKKGILYTIGSVIILILCFIAFILPSSMGRGLKSDMPVFGKYNKKEIRYDNTVFQNAVKYYGQMYQYYGIEISPQIHYDIYKDAFKQASLATAYYDYAEKSGYQAPDTAVNRQLKTYYQDENGKFSEKLYNKADPTEVKNNRESISESLMRSRFYEDIFGSESEIFGTDAFYGAKVSDAEVAFLQNYGLNLRAFKMASFDKTNYPEEEKAKYASLNKAKFVKYDFSVITVKEESLAKKISSRLANQEVSFEDAFSEYSEKQYGNSEGKLISSYQYQIENILYNLSDIDVLSAVAVGSVSPVIKTNYGYSIFRADSAAVQPDLDSDKIKSDVSSYILAYETTMIEDYFTAKAKDFIAKAKSTDFDSACTEFGAAAENIPAFPLNYGSISIADSLDTSISGLSGADKNENFLKAAFSLKENEVSEPIVMNDKIVVLKYTSTETKPANEDDVPTIHTNIENYDSSSAESSILKSPKMQDNFSSVYFANFE